MLSTPSHAAYQGMFPTDRWGDWSGCRTSSALGPARYGDSGRPRPSAPRRTCSPLGHTASCLGGPRTPARAAPQTRASVAARRSASSFLLARCSAFQAKWLSTSMAPWSSPLHSHLHISGPESAIRQCSGQTRRGRRGNRASVLPNLLGVNGRQLRGRRIGLRRRRHRIQVRSEVRRIGPRVWSPMQQRVQGIRAVRLDVGSGAVI